MNTETNANHCPKCQAPLPPNAPQGLCPKCLLDAVAAPTEAGQPGGKSPPPPLSTVAAAFPQLEVIEFIGQGGMGLVYKARQPKLERFVALKLLPQALAADPAFAERFNREARVMARLNHPNIVTVHDFGQAGSFFYLLMEFVDGVNLRQAMQAGRFTPGQALLLVPKICEALQFAHDEGILHRDIKPENILLDTHGRVKIADFGIAKLLGEVRDQLALTASGLAVGTPHYMAPEQLEHPSEVDQRADIYSLGVVFYEMLTGELPIGRFAPPSKKTAVDSRVDEVVLHALEKEREKRFRTASEVKTSVEAITSAGAQSTAAAGGPEPHRGEALASAAETRSACYFNTPQKMSDCFPSAAARIFTCKGELVLGPDELTFISPWRTKVAIPLRSIEDLSIGQFQMWTTRWVMKYARLSFLSISFQSGGQAQTVILTPVPPEGGAAREINLYVGRWFERLQRAVTRAVGTQPYASEPEAVSISAERAWNRKGLPLTFGFSVAFLAAWVLLPQRSLPVGLGLSVLMVSLLLLAATLWFCAGFLHANRALWRGNLDAVTSDEPPAGEPGVPAGKTSGVRRRSRSRLLNLSTVGVVLAGLLLPLGLLLWEAWLFPSFGERLFGKNTAASSSQLVLDVMPARFGPGSHDPRQFGGQVWNFKCLLPADRLVQAVFVRWTNGVPILEPGLSAYFKTGHVPADTDIYISCEPQAGPSAPGGTNQMQWNVNLGLGYTSAMLVPTPTAFRLLDTPARISARSGHQRAIRLLDCTTPDGKPLPGRDGVELRLLLKPLDSPAMRTTPSEKELNNYIGGAGLAVPMQEMLKWMKRAPNDP